MENKRWGTLRENGDGSTDLLVNGDVYSDGGTNRLLGERDMADGLDPGSDAPVKNSAVTEQFIKSSGTAVVMYPSEADLPGAVNFDTGVIASVGMVAWCVAERTWHKVSAVNASTLAITWTDYDPHINEAASEKDKYWGGTTKKWEQFETDHPAEAAKVEVRYITDDSETGSVVDAVENGNMRAVTSNAVYDVMDASKPLLVLTSVTFDEIGLALVTPPAGYKPISAMMTDTNWGFDVCYYQDKYFVVSRNLTEYNRRITNESIAVWIAYIKA